MRRYNNLHMFWAILAYSSWLTESIYLCKGSIFLFTSGDTNLTEWMKLSHQDRAWIIEKMKITYVPFLKKFWSTFPLFSRHVWTSKQIWWHLWVSSQLVWSKSFYTCLTPGSIIKWKYIRQFIGKVQGESRNIWTVVVRFVLGEIMN